MNVDVLQWLWNGGGGREGGREGRTDVRKESECKKLNTKRKRKE